MSIDKQIREVNTALMQPYCVVATVSGKRKMIAGPMPVAKAQDHAWQLIGSDTYKRPAFVKYPYQPKGKKKKPVYKK